MQQKSTSDDEHEQDEHASREPDAGARPFFAVLSFLIAMILLGTFLNNSLDGLTKMLLLFGVLAFGMFGVLLLEKQSRLSNALQVLIGGHETTDDNDDNEEATEPEDDMADEDQADETALNPYALTPFELLVQEALASIPDEFHDYMQNVAVLVESEPDAKTLVRVGTQEGHILLGLYQGVPVTGEGYQPSLLPKRITIYQTNIEYYCRYDPQRIREQVRKTVLHEVAHHFGIDHEEMPIWVK